jgi:hypothetical protein
MAVTYQFIGETNSVPYDAFGHVCLKKYIDMADLILHPEKLALASAPNVPLTSFAGFLGASSDILQLFHVPAGFHGLCGGSYIQAADTNTSATIALGDGDNTAGYTTAAALDGVSFQGTIGTTDAYGPAVQFGKGYKVADTIDILFGVATPIDAKVHFYIMGRKAFDITSSF